MSNHHLAKQSGNAALVYWRLAAASLPCLCLDQGNYLLKHPATSIAELPKHNRPAGACIIT